MIIPRLKHPKAISCHKLEKIFPEILGNSDIDNWFIISLSSIGWLKSMPQKNKIPQIHDVFEFSFHSVKSACAK
jgi:hypothetical protein